MISTPGLIKCVFTNNKKAIKIRNFVRFYSVFLQKQHFRTSLLYLNILYAQLFEAVGGNLVHPAELSNANVTLKHPSFYFLHVYTR